MTSSICITHFGESFISRKAANSVRWKARKLLLSSIRSARLATPVLYILGCTLGTWVYSRKSYISLVPYRKPTRSATDLASRCLHLARGSTPAPSVVSLRTFCPAAALQYWTGLLLSSQAAGVWWNTNGYKLSSLPEELKV